MSEEPIEPIQLGNNGDLYGSGSPNVVEIIKRLRQESKDARFPREMEWNRAWNLYNGIYDFTKKADWQHKNNLPRINTAVRAGTYLLKRGLVGPRDFYQTDGVGPVSKMIAPYVHKTTKFHLDQSNFTKNYVTALMSGMLSSLVILKVYPTMEDYDEVQFQWPKGGPVFPKTPPNKVPYDTFLADGAEPSKITKKKRKRLCIKYDPVNAYDYYPDPRGEGLYKIHTIDMDFYKLVRWEAQGKIKKGTCALIVEDYVRVDKEQQDAARQGQFAPYSSYARKRCTIDEFWGTLIDPGTGTILFENCYAMMINDKYMAVDPKPNPLPTKKDPFIVQPVIEKPFSVWHQGFVESVSGIAETLTDLMNLTLDGNLFSSIKAFELDIDQVYDPTEFAGGISPGKTFKKRGGGSNSAPMIRDISLGNFNPQVMELFLSLDRELQNGLGLNEFIAPQMRSGGGGRRTATEMMKKSQDSNDFFGEIAKCQEEGILEPSLELTYKYILHYQRDFDDPLLQELLGPEVATRADMLLKDPELKEFLIANPLKFQASGMSEISKRMKELDKIMAFINLAGNFAKVDPTILQRIKADQLFKKAIQALNWNEEDVMRMEEAPMNPTMRGNGAPNQPPPPTAGLPPNAPPNPSMGVSGHQGPAAAMGG